MKRKTALVVGAGLGGLATALRLAKKGYQVRVLEKNGQAGGRLNRIRRDGFTFDTGPSFFSMSYEFEDFARDCGIKLPFSYTPVDPLYTVSFADDPQPYLLYRDIRRLADRFAGVEPDFERKMERYLSMSGRIFDATVDVVVRQNFDSVRDYVLSLTRVDPGLVQVLLRTFWKHVCTYFDSEEARQIVSLVSFFLGRTPFDTSAVYSLLSHTEFRHDGYYNVHGGMYEIVTGLLGELEKEGVKMFYHTEVTGFETEGGRLTALTDREGGRWTGDVFVINSDAAAFRGRVFGRKRFSEKRLDRMGWTMGTLTMYVGVGRRLPQLHLHNYFLGRNFREYARRVFRHPGTLEKPYFYVNALSKLNPGCAPEGTEALFFVVPVPDLRFKKNWEDREAVADSVLEEFSARIGQDVRPDVVFREVYTPEDWEKRFNLYRGSGLGLAHDMRQVGGFRPKNYDEEFANVFYVGASTVPGTGLPMVLIGSKLVTQRIEKAMAEA